jgi:hypothetical protein
MISHSLRVQDELYLSFAPAAELVANYRVGQQQVQEQHSFVHVAVHLAGAVEELHLEHLDPALLAQPDYEFL